MLLVVARNAHDTILTYTHLDPVHIWNIMELLFGMSYNEHRNAECILQSEWSTCYTQSLDMKSPGYGADRRCLVQP